MPTKLEGVETRPHLVMSTGHMQVLDEIQTKLAAGHGLPEHLSDQSHPLLALRGPKGTLFLLEQKPDSHGSLTSYNSNTGISYAINFPARNILPTDRKAIVKPDTTIHTDHIEETFLRNWLDNGGYDYSRRFDIPGGNVGVGERELPEIADELRDSEIDYEMTTKAVMHIQK